MFTFVLAKIYDVKIENIYIFIIYYRNELKYFNRMTTKVRDPSKRNAVIMGRKTYFGIPVDKRPLPNRINIVLSRNPKPTDYSTDVILCGNFQEAIEKLSDITFKNEIENIWIVGGTSVYREAMESALCHRIYFTEIKANYECDAFFPTITDDFKLVPNDEGIPTEEQEENGIVYQYKIYERK